MNSAGTLSVTGTPLIINNSPLTINTGWSLIGCPYPSAAPIAGILGSNFSVVKDFTGFWTPTGDVTNSIQNVEPGKGYFVR
jgi:hypothetical protein